jgi:conjugative relaxase-like TrwC/TraI family protein
VVVAAVAWFRPLGIEAVAYHEQTVVGRADDHPGQALDYYGSRGETPLRWAGAGAERLGLVGEVTPAAYESGFGAGGFRDPVLGDRLVATTRPGFELVVSAHKSVAVLGVVGRADDMHAILDAETSATMGWLDAWFQERGGRRGREQRRTPTSGLTYALTRHGTSRAGDPAPHDHVLVANVVEMLDTKGGFKGLDSAALRDTTEAATMVGRLASAAKAVQLGYAIEPDDGPSGNLRHWRIVGVPREVCDVFSKRADEISEYLADSGYQGPRARGVAARQTRAVKRHTGVDELLPAWQAEIAALGWDAVRLSAHLDVARAHSAGLAVSLSGPEIDALAADVLAVDGDLMTRNKVFTRTRLVAEVAPRLYGADPAELDRVTNRILASRAVVPLVGVAGAHEQAYATAEVLATEQAIARTVETLAERDWPRVSADVVADAIGAKEQDLGRRLSAGQQAAVDAICGSGRAVHVVVGVAGAGKTTALDAATDALNSAGYNVVGTATSGQAARTLGAEADIEARTVASLLWRLDHHQFALDERTAVIVDEAGMTADADLRRLALGVERAGAKLILVGDPHQLSAIGPGGALSAVIERHAEIVTVLGGNVRQHDPAERAALSHLRDGSVAEAVDWYARAGRTQIEPTRIAALAGMVDAWVSDVAAGFDTALLAWRRADVADLNRLARAYWDQLGQLDGPELHAPGGRNYAAGDRVVLLAPQPQIGLVTSQRATVASVDPDDGTIVIETDDQQRFALFGEAIDATHLDHAYATTVHRAQGATYDRAHVLAAGGGRELGYVAMSRARERTTIHAVADDLTQAVEDIATDWSVDRRQRWITDTASPATDAVAGRTAPVNRDAQRQRLIEERDRLRQLAPPDVTLDLVAAQMQRTRLQESLIDLMWGRGQWSKTEAGRIKQNLADAQRRRQQAEAVVASDNAPWRMQRASRKDAHLSAEQEAELQTQWDAIRNPEVERLTTALNAVEKTINRLTRQRNVRDMWLRDHREVEHRLNHIDDELDAELAREPGSSLPRARGVELDGPGLTIEL